MTEKLYYKNSNLQEFSATVVSCEKTADGCLLVLNQTAFFPEGGGQSGDRGFIGDVRVLDTREKDGIIYHYTKECLKPGEQVACVLDYEERFSKMQQHSGEHIISGLIHKRFGYDNVGFHLGKELVTMDFNGVFQEGDLEEIEYQANEIVALNKEILIAYPSQRELESLEYRSKIEILDQIRIVTIPDVDVCACCAPHVTHTGEIGMIKLTSAMHYKGGTRVSMLCGFRALLDYRIKEKSVSNLSVFLSAKPDALLEAVTQQREEIRQYKDKLIRLQNCLVDSQLQREHNENENFFLFTEELDNHGMRRFVNEGKKRTKQFCGCFTGNDQMGYRYIIGSENLDARILSEILNEAFAGKGGGSKAMVQGSLNGSMLEIKNSSDQVLHEIKEVNG